MPGNQVNMCLVPGAGDPPDSLEILLGPVLGAVGAAVEGKCHHILPVASPKKVLF